MGVETIFFKEKNIYIHGNIMSQLTLLYNTLTTRQVRGGGGFPAHWAVSGSGAPTGPRRRSRSVGRQLSERRTRSARDARLLGSFSLTSSGFSAAVASFSCSDGGRGGEAASREGVHCASLAGSETRS